MKFRLISSLVIAALLITGTALSAPEEAVNDIAAVNHVSTQQPQETTLPAQTDPAVVELTKEEAIAIALAHAGLTEEDVTGLKAEYDVDDGQPEYDIEFRSGDYEYDYTVHAVTGKILERSREYDPPEQPAPVETQPPETVPAETEPAETEPRELTKKEAIAIALAHAGLTEDDVTGLKAEYDVDDGQPEYDIEFRSGDYEYDYTVHAVTGKILERSREYDPPEQPAPVETQPPETEPVQTEPVETEPRELTKKEAIAIALAHAGLTEEDVTGLKAEYDVDDGQPEYDIEFRSGDYEYDYTVHAVTGEIRDWDKEYDPKVKTEPVQTEPAETEPQELTRDEAIAIALAHAGLTEDQVKGLEWEYDVDDGVPQFEIQFRNKGWEYEYTIHARTGEILEWDKEYDD